MAVATFGLAFPRATKRRKRVVKRSWAGRPQRPDERVERLDIARNHAVVPDLPVPASLSDRHVDPFLVDIQPYEHAAVPHDLPPRLGRGAKRQMSRIIHDVTAGRFARRRAGPPRVRGPRRRPSHEHRP